MHTRLTRVMALALTALAAFPSAASADSGGDDRVTATLSATGVTANRQGFDGIEDNDKSGGVYRGTLGWDHDNGPDHLALDLSSAYYAYEDPTLADRWSNRVALAYGRDLAEDVRLTLRTDAATKLSTLESSQADQAQVRGELMFSPGDHRLRLLGGWRWRDYKDIATGSGDGVTAEAEYRYKTSKTDYFLIEGLYEEVDSNVLSRSFNRKTVRGVYHFNVVRNVSVDAGVAWREWTYKNRFVGAENLKERSWNPSLGVSFEFLPDWFAEADGLLIDRNANNPSRNSTIKRFSFGVKKVFRIKD